MLLNKPSYYHIVIRMYDTATIVLTLGIIGACMHPATGCIFYRNSSHNSLESGTVGNVARWSYNPRTSLVELIDNFCHYFVLNPDLDNRTTSLTPRL
jgi:hypothetical protein